MTKADLYRLVDALPDASVEPAGRWLERAQDPMIAILDAAPWDDEPYTDEERAAVEAGRLAYRRGEGIALEDLTAELDEPNAAAR